LYTGSNSELLIINTLTGLQTIVTINPGGYSDPDAPVVYNGNLYFWADDGIHGKDFWSSDGTMAGTHLVKDINPGMSWSIPSGYDYGSIALVNNGSLYFMADSASQDYLWKSDGTAAGTAPITNPSVMQPFDHYSYWQDLTVMQIINGKIFFPGMGSTTGLELWQSDGTANGTMMMFNEICQGVCLCNVPCWSIGYGGYGNSLYDDGNTLYFAGDDSIHGLEPWTLNVTTGIPNYVSSSHFMIFPNPASSYITLKTTDNYTGYRVQLFDLLGREVKVVDPVNQNETMIERSDLPPGIYALMVTNRAGKILFTQKVIFQ